MNLGNVIQAFIDLEGNESTLEELERYVHEIKKDMKLKRTSRGTWAKPNDFDL
jgi:hypothetical protein